MEKEIFKDIPNYKGYYQVSNLGRIKSLSRLNSPNEKILKIMVDKEGYSYINLSVNKNHKRSKIQRLVLAAFQGKSDLQTNHKNGIKSDNRLENLEYCTGSENCKHAFKLGLKNQNGEKNPNVRLTKKEVFEIRELYNNKIYSQFKLGKIYNVCQATIYQIINNLTWMDIGD